MSTQVSQLQSRAQQTIFIVRSGAVPSSLKFPPQWNHIEASTLDQLATSLRQAENKRQLALVIVGESEFSTTLSGLSKLGGHQSLTDLAILVTAQNPSQFLRLHAGVRELFDVLTPAQLSEALEFQLLRAVRWLMQRSKRESRKINQEMLERLNHIFITLSSERDQKRLLTTILAEAIGLTGAERGSLFMAEEVDGEMILQLKISQDMGAPPLIEPIKEKATENSICGYVMLTGKALNIPIGGGLRPALAMQFQRATAQQEESHKSILAVPLKNSENEIIAVLELVNKKGEKRPQAALIDSFDPEDESLISSFIAQAAICLENMQLYADIREVFDGFVKASVTAIEARDPSTGGHSERVADMTVALADATSRTDKGIYRSVKFKPEEIQELEYAALLHDVGKIGVREEVLVKAKKLYPYQLEAIGNRIRVCKEALYVRSMEKGKKGGASDKDYRTKLAELENFWTIIQASNEPTVLREQIVEGLEKILSYELELTDGHKLKLINESEYRALSVPIGSLTEEERLEVESHVRHTYQFLKMIPWTKTFRNLPDIAHAHHEKLDGSGYPRGLLSHEIPLQSKIMTIADIYDALTASDRWYKDAVPTEKALDILAQEVNLGQLDPILFDIFLEAKIYEIHTKKFRKAGQR